MLQWFLDASVSFCTAELCDFNFCLEAKEVMASYKFKALQLAIFDRFSKATNRKNACLLSRSARKLARLLPARFKGF